MAQLKQVATATIDSKSLELSGLGSEIHKNPELGSEEFKAHDLLTDFLETEGFFVERSYTGIETAFRATFGSGKPNVCVICEYDALPEIGHACGHNLIAEAGVAAGLGLKAVLESGEVSGTVTVLGTPDEEATAKKINLIDNGAFSDVDFAMMVHPFPQSIVQPDFICSATIAIKYTGKAAHAAAFPWEGVNALDAAVMAYTSISALRQQMKPTWRVHGVITNGGAKPNIIPEKTELEFYVRTPTKAELDQLHEKVTLCFKSAAAATGCQLEIVKPCEDFLDIIHNPTLSELYLKNVTELGENDVTLTPNTSVVASSDMGNVSHIVPSIHPIYAIGSGEVNHTREFTAEAHKATLTAAKAMAHTCIDVLTTDGLLEKIKHDFNSSAT